MNEQQLQEQILALQTQIVELRIRLEAVENQSLIREELDARATIKQAADEISDELAKESEGVPHPVRCEVKEIDGYELTLQTGWVIFPSDDIHRLDHKTAKALGCEYIKVVTDKNKTKHDGVTLEWTEDAAPVKNESIRNLYQELRELLSGSRNPLLPDLDAIIRTVREHDSNKSE